MATGRRSAGRCADDQTPLSPPSCDCVERLISYHGLGTRCPLVADICGLTNQTEEPQAQCGDLGLSQRSKGRPGRETSYPRNRPDFDLHQIVCGRTPHPSRSLNRKNALFAGHDQGAENWACIALIETCKLPEIERRRSATVLYQCIAQGAAYDSIGRCSG